VKIVCPKCGYILDSGVRPCIICGKDTNEKIMVTSGRHPVYEYMCSECQEKVRR